MSETEITDVFIMHAEYELLSDAGEIDTGDRMFTFANADDETVVYYEYEHDSYIATHTDVDGETNSYRVTPQRSIWVSTLVVNRYGYTLVEDATTIDFV